MTAEGFHVPAQCRGRYGTPIEAQIADSVADAAARCPHP